MSIEISELLEQALLDLVKSGRFPDLETAFAAVMSTFADSELRQLSSRLVEAAGSETLDAPSPQPAPRGDETTTPWPSSTLPYETDNEDPDAASVFVINRESATGADGDSVVFTAEQRYRIIRQMAQGGLGVVHFARDEVFGREVALKYIRPHLDSTSSFVRDRFLIEARLTGNLEHPGIIGLYAIGRDSDGRPFYVMRLIRGENLHASIDRYHRDERRDTGTAESTLGLRKLINRLVAVCNAVGFAHSRGVLHRDIKPANIMVGKYGETLLVDWGLAKLLYRSVGEDGGSPSSLSADLSDAVELTSSGMVVGSPAYMSPEQALGRQDLMEPTSDVFSLGATLYQILTGRVPYAGMALRNILEAVQKGSFPVPRSILPSVDPALEAICLKAMAFDPDDRYPTARLADDLERWLADEAVTAYREPPLQRCRGGSPVTL